MRKIIFTKKFANKEIGDTMNCASQLASQLVNEERVAKYDTSETETVAEKPTKKTTKK